MEVKFLGWQSFLLREKKIKVLTTPYEKQVGVSFPKVAVDIVVTRKNLSAELRERIKPYSRKEIFVTPGPGEYEVERVQIVGFEFGYWLDILGWSILYCWESSVQKISELEGATDRIDLMFLGWGKGGSKEARRTVEFVKKISPSVIIPFTLLGLSKEEMRRFLWAEGFLDVFDQEGLEPSDLVKLDRQELEGEARIFLLKPKI